MNRALSALVLFALGLSAAGCGQKDPGPGPTANQPPPVSRLKMPKGVKPDQKPE